MLVEGFTATAYGLFPTEIVDVAAEAAVANGSVRPAPTVAIATTRRICRVAPVTMRIFISRLK